MARGLEPQPSPEPGTVHDVVSYAFSQEILWKLVEQGSENGPRPILRPRRVIRKLQGDAVPSLQSRNWSCDRVAEMNLATVTAHKDG